MGRRATVIRVDDAATFVIRPNMAVKLFGVIPPDKDKPEGVKAKKKLEELILGKKVEFDTIEWDRFGRSVAEVYVDSQDINAVMKQFLKTLP